VRASRLIYVENDPALRGIMVQLLKQHSEIELLLASPSPTEVLADDRVRRADVALIDLALGGQEINGLDLGIALRELNTDIGIVIHSQYPLTHLARRVPEELRIAWTFLQKSGDMSINDLVAVLRSTAAGLGGQRTWSDDADHQLTLNLLTPRQRAVMALASAGMGAGQIGQRLEISADSVRQDLSKSYRALVPNPKQGDDL
jgi:two-component system response regulator DesR